MNKLKKIITETYYEMKKISWSSSKNVLNNSILVISILILSSVFFFIVDTIFYKSIRNIIFRFYHV